MDMTLKKAKDVNTAAVTTLGLIGGWVSARETGIRPLGGVLLAAAGVYAGRTWLAKGGPALTAGLTTAYVAGFGLSHPLAKKMGSWPAVLTVTAGVAGASYVLADKK
ncbi:hypothetical protein [Corynebacterium glyciniphilum]|nr:hypothetical protein [Corynebacterium glyciniphilum]